MLISDVFGAYSRLSLPGVLKDCILLIVGTNSYVLYTHH